MGVVVALLGWGPDRVAQAGLPAFPGAEGFGSETSHARGKPVFIVTRLDDEGGELISKRHKPGQFRWALAKAKEEGGGYIVFEVAGDIELKSDLVIPSHTCIAGQTAPGTGVAIVRRAMNVGKYRTDDPHHDIVVRFLRGRGQFGKGLDFMEIFGRQTHHIVCDHLSVSGFQDGAVDITNGAHDITVQWCHLGDARDSFTNESYHGQPHLMGDNVTRVTFHHCLYTHIHSRAPWLTFKNPGAKIEFSNNIVYNYRKYPTAVEAAGGLGIFVGNLYLAGPNTHGDGSVGVRPAILGSGGFRGYFRDNLGLGGLGHDNRRPDGVTFPGKDQHVMRGRPAAVAGSRPRRSDPETNIMGTSSSQGPKPGVFEALAKPPEGFPPVTYHPVDQLPGVLLSDFGVVPHDRTDERLIGEVIERKGFWRLIPPNDGNESLGVAPPDDDRDGMADDWEREHGGDLVPNGHELHPEYDNIEIYLEHCVQQRFRRRQP
ncbi:MAG: hypothetical protein ACKO3P_22985, partial [Planctomycetaceae bacterium]